MASHKLTLEQLNILSLDDFQGKFRNVIEHSTYINTHIYSRFPFQSFDDLVREFADNLNNLTHSAKEKILLNYPDLAGKLADQGKLSTESAFEHNKAGLDSLTPKQNEEIRRLNQAYRTKFGIPCVICVRETKSVDEIIASIKIRLENERDAELDAGIKEVIKICRIRISEIVQ